MFSTTLLHIYILFVYYTRALLEVYAGYVCIYYINGYTETKEGTLRVLHLN